jgi:hypothetical protein
MFSPAGGLVPSTLEPHENHGTAGRTFWFIGQAAIGVSFPVGAIRPLLF